MYTNSPKKFGRAPSSGCWDTGGVLVSDNVTKMCLVTSDQSLCRKLGVSAFLTAPRCILISPKKIGHLQPSGCWNIGGVRLRSRDQLWIHRAGHILPKLMQKTWGLFVFDGPKMYTDRPKKDWSPSLIRLLRYRGGSASGHVTSYEYIALVLNDQSLCRKLGVSVFLIAPRSILISPKKIGHTQLSGCWDIGGGSGLGFTTSGMSLGCSKRFSGKLWVVMGPLWVFGVQIVLTSL